MPIAQLHGVAVNGAGASVAAARRLRGGRRSADAGDENGGGDTNKRRLRLKSSAFLQAPTTSDQKVRGSNPFGRAM